MKTWRTLYHITRADFLERTRRYSFLITVGVTIYLAYLYLPPSNASYVTFGLGNYRGVYNSAWVGSVIAALCIVQLALVSFYLIKNAIERDFTTGVGQIIATTPLSKLQYTFGKMLSNLFFLMTMVIIIMLAAIGMQLLRGEVFQIELWTFVAPFLFLVLPVMALVAALAVLFETISWLRSGFGNIVYFFLWVFLLASIVSTAELGSTDAQQQAINEPLGLTILTSNVVNAFKVEHPEYDGIPRGATAVTAPVQTFVWDGVKWSVGMVLKRLFWVGVALGLTLISSLFFHRFDLSREKPKRRRSNDSVAVKTEVRPWLPAVPTPPRLTTFETRETSGINLFGRIVLAELRLMLKGLHWWWYLIATGLAIASFLAPLNIARQYILPAAWVWPVLLWSAMGNREVRNQTNQLVFSAAHPLRRQLPAALLTGWIVALLTGGGLGVRFVLTGQWGAFSAWFVGAAFIPSLAMALGVWSGGSKLFEVIYILLWYIGPMSRVVFLDYMGVTNDAVSTRMPLYYMVVTILLWGLTLVGQRKRIRV